MLLGPARAARREGRPNRHHACVPDPASPIPPWARRATDVAAGLGVDVDTGLTGPDAAEALVRWGPNQLADRPSRSVLSILVAQFKSIIVLLLVGASGLSMAFSEWAEAVAVLGVIVINGAIGFWTELRAVRSMEALRQLGQVQARVRRNGDVHSVPADSLVPGDVVLIEGGDVVSADLRLVRASKIQSNESLLTGESVPVDKEPSPVPAAAPIHDRTNMLFRGTSVTRGAGIAVVVATGARTEIGRIAAMVAEAAPERTPLERELSRLGQGLVWVVLAISVAVAGGGLLAGQGLVTTVQTAIALAVASVPEGLPIIATIALARGMWRMARRNALVNRLSAVETLGATGIICSDKTGTLTENRMSVVELRLPFERFAVGPAQVHPVGPGEVDPRRALEIGALCNNAGLEGEEGVGDPLEVALLRAAESHGIHHLELARAQPEAREVAFDPEVRLMAKVHHTTTDGRYRVTVKGGPEVVLDCCTRVQEGSEERALLDTDRARIVDAIEAMGAGGQRVLAVAEKTVSDLQQEVYTDLTFVGLVGLWDPPRREVGQVIDACREAGVGIVMVTGDQASTAVAVARAVGLGDGTLRCARGDALEGIANASPETRARLRETQVFARVSPHQKLDLIKLHQDAGAVVAMTGDGVNDAPALEKADIGVAMGERGTDVAREAADMVLKDDSLATVAVAIGQGRVIFDNIRKFVVYLLSCNISEIVVVALGSFGGLMATLTPLQILFLNLLTDVFPALALGVGEGDGQVMRRRPRPANEPILTQSHWASIVAWGALLSVAVLGAVWYGTTRMGLGREEAVTVAFFDPGARAAVARVQHGRTWSQSGGGAKPVGLGSDRAVLGHPGRGHSGPGSGPGSGCGAAPGGGLESGARGQCGALGGWTADLRGPGNWERSNCAPTADRAGLGSAPWPVPLHPRLGNHRPVRPHGSRRRSTA